MTPSCQSHGFRPTPQLIVGLLVISIGVIFTLDSLGFAPAVSYLRFWPMAIVAVGVLKMLYARDGGGAFVGLIFTSVGVWLLGEELKLFHINMRNVWPLVLVAFGGYLVYQAVTKRGATPPPTRTPDPEPFPPLDPLGLGTSSGWPGTSDTSNQAPASDFTEREQRRSKKGEPRITDTNSTMTAMAILGGVSRGNNSSSFRSADLLAIMGGLEIDLRKAAINGEAFIDIFVMWGGIEIRVPEDWTVVSQIVPLMGGVDDRTRPPQGATAHRLVLRGAAVMGGIEVKN